MTKPTLSKMIPITCQTDAEIPCHIVNTLENKASLSKAAYTRLAKNTRKDPTWNRRTGPHIASGLTVDLASKQKRGTDRNVTVTDGGSVFAADEGFNLIQETRRFATRGTETGRETEDDDENSEEVEKENDVFGGVPASGKALFGFASVRKANSVQTTPRTTSRVRFKDITASGTEENEDGQPDTPTRVNRTPKSAMKKQSTQKQQGDELLRTPSRRGANHLHFTPGNEIPGSPIGTPSNKRTATSMAAGLNRTTEQSAKRRRTNRDLAKLNDAASGSESSDGEDEGDAEETQATAKSKRHKERVDIPLQIEEENKDEDEDDSDDDDDDKKEEEEGTAYERYFENLHTTGIHTSNNTLSKLPVLEHSEFVEALLRVPVKHEAELKKLSNLQERQFDQWLFELRNGFNLIFYGYGSKRNLLAKFATTFLTDGPLLVVNGYFPSISAKEILGKILDGVLHHAGATGTIQEQTTLVKAYFEQPDRACRKLYILIHNIDGTNLRHEPTQRILSLLASCPNIHLIASVDHINAALLWDTVKAAQFNWVWHNVTTFDSYMVETSFENSIMVRRGDLGPRGIGFVLSSLPDNAKKVFRILAEHQIRMSQRGSKDNVDEEGEDAEEGIQSEMSANQKNKGIGPFAGLGLSYQTFYTKAQEGFLVSSEINFRSQLTEFRDHKIIHSRRMVDGTEILFIPLDANTLGDVLEKMP